MERQERAVPALGKAKEVLKAKPKELVVWDARLKLPN
jgi:hypothetical protein